MIPKLKISTFLLKRLEKVKQQCSGCLFGVFYGDGILLLLGFNLESTIGQLNYKNIQYRFPAEIDLCGLVKFGDCTDNECHLNEIIQDVDITDNPILLNCKIGTLVELKASIFMHGKLQDIPYEVMTDEELYSNFCFTRLKCNFKLYTNENEESIKKDVQDLRKKVASGRLAFNVNNSNIFLTAGENGRSANQTAPSETRIEDVLNLIESNTDQNKAEDSIKKSSKKKNQNEKVKEKRNEYEIINIEVLKNRTREPNNSDNKEKESLPSMAMRIYREEKKLVIPLEVDAMAILYIETKLLGLYDILIESICRSLRLIENSLVERLIDVKANSEKTELEIEEIEKIIVKLSQPEIFHFCPNDFGHFITVVYLKDLGDDLPIMQQKRKKFHHLFALPTIKPNFRRGNRYLFKSEIPLSPLINTHIGLKPSGVKNGQQYLVQLNYSYYHYMQQNFDDNGWGCAYRSLQTLCSWFKWHGYTNQEIPTHEKIQQYLYNVGDKPKSFVGSKQWIGSTEVSMCLQGFLNVDSKILHCNSGGDLSRKGCELAMHFQSQGTPIMIGGGVLAHTIIGVEFNEESNEIKFLILDPHYTGEDDLSIIQGKGWCGWKGSDFWDKKSYYNLCMPQRPIIY